MSDEERIVVGKGKSRWPVDIDGVEVAAILKEYGGGGIHDFYYCMEFNYATELENEVAENIGEFRQKAPDMLRNRKEEVMESLREEYAFTQRRLGRIKELIDTWESI
jgi:hypothetical protein